MDHLPLSDIPMLVSSIASYVNAMSPTLYKALSQGNDAYLKEHSTFGAQLEEAIFQMAGWLDNSL